MVGKHTRYMLFAALIIILGGIFTASTVTAAVSLSVDAKVKPTNKNVPHFWSACVGTGTMWYSLKPQWKVGARIGASEAGFKRMRGHGMLRGSDGGDSLKIFHWDGTNAPTYTWTVLDSILTNYMSYGMQPVMELDFMPKDLQSNGVTSKPKNWNIWRDFIKAMVVHCESKYGVAEVRTWFWEVWNEPDYNGFWNGTIADYDTLYAKAAEGGKSADSLVLFGGPSSTGSGQLSAFLTFCTNNHVPLDFLSNHCYGGGGSGPSADPVNIRSDNRTRAYSYQKQR